MPSRLDKEPSHGRKTGKSSGHIGRSAGSKNALLTESHDNSPKPPTISAPTKRQSLNDRSTSPSSDKKEKQQQQQQLSKRRSKSPPISSDEPIKSSCMFMNI
jgi:hypothetical protein